MVGLIILVISVVYLSCVVIISGWSFAYWQGEFTHDDPRDDAGISLIFGMLLGFFGPLGVIFMYCLTGFARYGWIKPSIKGKVKI